MQNSRDATSSTAKEVIPTSDNATSIFIDTSEYYPTFPDEVSPNPLPEQSPNPVQNKLSEPNKTTPPIASLDPADFQPNPILESILAEQVRNSDIITVVETPSMDTILKFNQNIFLKVAGTTTTKSPYELVIYSNRVFDFENDHRMLSHSLSGVRKDEKFGFSFNAKIPFSRGLYYWLLLSEGEEQVLHISRFKVE